MALNLALLKQCSIVGVNWGARNRADKSAMRKELAVLLQWHADGKLNPEVTTSYRLEQASDALYELAHRRAKGKVVLLTRHYKEETPTSKL